MTRPFWQGATASEVFDIDEDEGPPGRDSSSSPMVIDDEIQELDYVVVPDDELLADEHTDEPISHPNSYTVPIEGYKAELQSYRFNDLTLLAGGRMTVEFYNQTEIEFLKIIYIRRDMHSEEVTLIGHRFIKNSHPDLGGVLDTTYQDEVCWLVGLVPTRTLGHLYEIPIEWVTGQRQIVLTNERSPKALNESWHIHEDLVCRWKVVVHYPNKSSRCNPSQSIVRRLQEAECDPQWLVPEDELRRCARGETLKGGSARGIKPFEKARLQEEAAIRQHHAETAPAQSALTITGPDSFLDRPQPYRNVSISIDSDDDDDIRIITGPNAGHRRPTSHTTNRQRIDLDRYHPRTAPTRGLRDSSRLRQRYTFGDSFCGGGGVSRGAQMAGLAIEWGFDRGEDQCHTWRKNFPYAKCHHRDVTSFLGAEANVKVDILHLSPPCQPYSPANTRPNIDKDEENTATAFAISELLERCRPRLVTMENTFGLLQRKPEYFHRFIGLFTAKDYSVRWTILDMANYGVPQRRQRLIVIASCLGEALPTFPPYTHAKVPTQHLAPWVSINSALSDIPYGWADHDVTQTMARGAGTKRPPDGDSVAKCVTCKGGDNSKHPNGQRGYTNREFASLQTFPLYHEFRPLGIQKITTIREQIGNAVPPRFAKILYGWLRKWLEEQDGVQGPEVMDLEDD